MSPLPFSSPEFISSCRRCALARRSHCFSCSHVSLSSTCCCCMDGVVVRLPSFIVCCVLSVLPLLLWLTVLPLVCSPLPLFLLTLLLLLVCCCFYLHVSLCRCPSVAATSFTSLEATTIPSSLLPLILFPPILDEYY